ncbi:myosin-J heavy chain-like [Montipora capricornis]|uniref:myosin-J heavy chain-like n=1 Tax=Montipora capricornis TaxID=246305 RepID=UPI0035F10B87
MAEKEEDLGLSETGDQESRVQDIQECKQDNRNAKRHMTRLLNKLAATLSEDDQISKTEIKDMLHKIEEQQDHTIMAIDRLESLYRQKKEEALADKACSFNPGVSHESEIASGSVADSEASLRRREKEKAEQEARLRRDQLEWEIEQNREQIKRQEQELHAVNQELNKRRQELEDEIDEEFGLEKGFFEDYHPLPMQQEKLTETQQLQQEVKTSKKSTMESDKHETHHSNNSGHVQSAKITPPETPKLHCSRNSPDTDFATENRETHGQLERIRIPIFSGNKMDFQRWNAAFTSCVDMSSLSAQFKMLRLEACLAGEAANTIKGLGYSSEAYEAAKARLFRKYGGSRRQIQSHLEELKKLQPIQDNNAKELETFADVLERAAITLKENNRNSDLEPGALHTTILEKIPERLLTQYYRWVDENKYRDSLETLKDWISEEADYQMQATEIKNGISVEDRNEPPRDGKHNFRRRSRSDFGDNGGKGNQKCCLCAGSHPLLKSEHLRNSPSTEDGRRSNGLDCASDV